MTENLSSLVGRLVKHKILDIKLRITEIESEEPLIFICKVIDGGISVFHVSEKDIELLPELSTADMSNLFDRVIAWNNFRCNTNFNHFLETKMWAEELFEFCGYSREESKCLSIKFAKEHSGKNPVIREAMIDASGDISFIAIGTIMKLGGNPEEVLRTICDHNDAKGSKKDKDGKILKDATFIEPIHEI